MAQDTLTLANVNDSGLQGIVLDSCPFPRNGSWADGALMRDSLLSASGTLVGATGPLGMSVGEDDDGRDVDTVTFCAVNLKPDATHGARFEVISTLDGATLDSEDGEGFQAISPFQEAQTFPAGALTYPPDRPILQGRHMDVRTPPGGGVVMRRDAPPFVFVDGDGSSIDDFTGITPEFLEKLADVVGFTYSLRAPPEGTTTPDTIEMVRNGSADMTGSWITITSERAEYVSFTYPYFDLGIAFVYLPTIDEGVNFWKAFAPFEASLWLMLLVSLVVTVVLLWLFEGAKNDQFSRGGWGRRHRTVTRVRQGGDGWGTLMFRMLRIGHASSRGLRGRTGVLHAIAGISRSVYVTSSLMMSQLTHKPETLEGYLLTLGWLFTSFVLAASYTAELASFLTASKLETTVLNGSALTTLADSATADYQLQNDFCGLTTLAEVLYPQATLQLREDGTLIDIEESYLDPSVVCVPVTTSEEESSNMTISVRNARPT
ncbi:unnamed protein product [Ectocarpus sp. CCAP 1310/34]|nr:unnamed protein product [Ectocarpus sp. CCAP 1310/34]